MLCLLVAVVAFVMFLIVFYDTKIGQYVLMQIATIIDEFFGTEYDVKIDKSAFGAAALERVGKNEPVPVTDVVAGFETTKASLAAKSFVFTGSAGNLNAKGLVANTSGTAKDINLVFASFDENGRMIRQYVRNPDGTYQEGILENGEWVWTEGTVEETQEDE